MIFAYAIGGPTASGKTALSLAVAKALNAEILSCDSMQIYRDMNIGTAKATADEQAEVPHHLIDICDPCDAFSAENYRALAINTAKEVQSRGKVPLFVGGTGLYLDTLTRSPAKAVPESRREYRERAEALGADYLWERLCRIDPASAEKTHKNNLRRVIRALEIFDATGKTKSELDALTRTANREISLRLAVLDFHDRELLYRRTDERVDAMFAAGLVDEVADLLRAGKLAPTDTAAQAIGYKEVVRALTDGAPIERAVEEVKLATRHYAKRQLTWFRHEEGAKHIFADDENGVLRSTEELVNEAICFFKEAESLPNMGVQEG